MLRGSSAEMPRAWCCRYAMLSHLRRRRGASVAAFVGGSLLALVLFDTGLRVIERTPLWRVLPVVEPIPGRPDPEFGFDSIPGAQGIWTREHRSQLRVNSLGLRDVERQLRKPPGTVRVGLLGDSMIEAAQVSQEATFGTLAERRLRVQGVPVELINLAVAGPSPLRQLLRLERRGYALNLDLVLANSADDSFVSGTLLDDSQNPGYVDAGDGRLVLGYAFRQRFSHRHADDLLGRAFIALYQASPLVRMLYFRAKEPWPEMLGLAAVQAAPQYGGPPPGEPGITETCRSAEAALRPHSAFWQDHEPARPWAATARFLDDLSASAKAHGVQVLYAVRDIPLAPEGCPLLEARRAELIARMAAEFSRHGMTFVDWSTAVAAAAGTRDLSLLHGFGVRRGGGHLNYDGHRAWAAALISVLEPHLHRLLGDR
jgi:hypothetical protein